MVLSLVLVLLVLVLVHVLVVRGPNRKLWLSEAIWQLGLADKIMLLVVVLLLALALLALLALLELLALLVVLLDLTTRKRWFCVQSKAMICFATFNLFVKAIVDEIFIVIV